VRGDVVMSASGSVFGTASWPVRRAKTQVVTAGMEVALSSVGSAKVEYVKGVRGQSFPVARGTRTAVALTMLLAWNRDRPVDCFGEARAELRLDPDAMGTQLFRLYLGALAADPADLLDRPSIEVEEAQPYGGHNSPSWRAP